MCGNKLPCEIKIITINQTAVIVACHRKKSLLREKNSLVLCPMKFKENTCMLS